MRTSLTFSLLFASEAWIRSILGSTLSLCDCGPAEGSPHGLTCEKEGYFVRGFERSGQWVSGGGGVPLSRAECCRPCFQEEMDGGWNNATVVSAACGPRPRDEGGEDGASVSCGTFSNSFLAGFEHASPVTLASDVYYPSGGAVCRSAALVNSTGNVRMLERCECTESMDVSCGSSDPDLLQWGFESWRTIPFQMMDVTVPMAPAKCCKVCLAPEGKDADGSCPKDCSGRGVCNFGCCICDQGYSGEDCSQTGQGGASIFSQPWILVAFCLMTFSTLGFIGFLVQQIAANQVLAHLGNQDTNEGATPLLREDGLSGTDLGETSDELSSWGTDSEDLEEGHPVPGLSSRLLDQSTEAGVSHSAPTELHLGMDTGGNIADTEEVIAHEEEALDAEKQKEANKSAKGKVPPNPDFECLICMSRKIQVVAIPCGHACSCRHCAKKLRRCPICREIVTRRQKLYIGQ